MQHQHSPDPTTVPRTPGWYVVAVPTLLTVLAAVVVVAGS